MKRLFEAFLRRLPLRVIEVEGDAYLARWYLLGKMPENFPVDVRTTFGWLPFTVFIHCFLRSDQPEDLHNHPWETSWSFILKGGYYEERGTILWNPRPLLVEVRAIERKPGRVVRIRHRDFHRVSLRNGHCWTLFITHKKLYDWGFLSRRTGEYIPWRTYVKRPYGVELAPRVEEGAHD